MHDRSRYTPTQWVVHVLGGVLLPGALLFGRLFAPFVDKAPVMCVSRRLLGRRCLGCGMTHAVCLAADGRWAAACDANLLVVPMLIVFAFITFRSLSWLIRACIRRNP